MARRRTTTCGERRRRTCGGHMLGLDDTDDRSRYVGSKHGVSAMPSVRFANLLIILSGCYLSMRLQELVRRRERS